MDCRGARATLAVAILLVLCVGDTRSDPTATSDVQVHPSHNACARSCVLPHLALRLFCAALRRLAACGLRRAGRDDQSEARSDAIAIAILM